MSVKYDAGPVTAYAAAVEGGYTGTYAEFCAEQAQFAKNAQQVAQNAAQVASDKASVEATAEQVSNTVETFTETTVPEATTAIQQEGTAQVQTVEAEGAEQVQAVSETGEDYIQRIRGLVNDKADVSGNYPDMTVGTAEQLLSDTSVVENEPYHFRKSGDGNVRVGDREVDRIVGGTVAWNQLVLDANRDYINSAQTDTRTSFLLSIQNILAPLTVAYSATISTTGRFATVFKVTQDIGTGIRIKHNGAITDLVMYMNYDLSMYKNHVYIFSMDVVGIDPTTINGLSVKNLTLTDLTTAFADPTIADYIYTIHSSTAGAGVAFVRKYIDIDTYHEFDAGTLKSVDGLVSHDMVGFNQWDEERENGTYDSSTGEKQANAGLNRSKNKIHVLPSTQYYIKRNSGSSRVFYYDYEKNYIDSFYWDQPDFLFTTPANCHYITFAIVTSAWSDDICINLSDPAKNGTYEPYVKHSYPLDSTVTLRGVFKLSDGKLVADGDEYWSTGEVPRKYGIKTVNGSEDWTKSTSYTGNYYLTNGAIGGKSGTLNIITSNGLTPVSTVTELAQKDMVVFFDGGSSNANINIKNTSMTTLDAFKGWLANNPITIVYELATSTTEQAAPFTSPQWVDGSGTEQYVSTSLVPIGHYTQYTEDLKSKVESAPDNPEADGDYILRRTNGVNAYAPLSETIDNTFTKTGKAADAKATGDRIGAAEEDVADLKDALTENVAYDVLSYKVYLKNYHGECFPAGGTGYSTIDITTPTAAPTFDALIVPCTANDSFVVYAVGGTTTYAWAFIDSSGTILSKSASNATVNGTKVTAPANTAHLVVNDKSGALRVYDDYPKAPFNALDNKINTETSKRAYNAVFYIADNASVSWSAFGVSPVEFNVGNKNFLLRMNGKDYTITPTSILDAATSAGLTVTGSKITGTSYIIYFDITTETVKAVIGATTTANLLIQATNPVIFYAHFAAVRAGLAVDFMTVKRIEPLESATITNSNDIENIKEIIESEIIPSYFDSNLSEKTPQIIDNMNEAGPNGTTFVFITDLHWETNYRKSPQLVKYILDKTSIKDVFCGGDIINQGEKADMCTVFLDCINHYRFVPNNGFFPIAKGNHDDNSNWSTAADIATYEFDDNTIYNLLYSQVAELTTRIGSNWAFYFDQQAIKTRYIFVDTKRNGLTIDYSAIINCMSAVQTGWHIIIVMHFTLANATTLFAGCDLLAHIVKAYNDRSSGSYAGTYQTATYDFTNAVGTVDLIIGGHVHADYAMDADDANNPAGVPIIATDTDSYRNHPGTEGTVNSQCFDVVTVDYTNKTVKCVRIGRGSNRSFSYGN